MSDIYKIFNRVLNDIVPTEDGINLIKVIVDNLTDSLKKQANTLNIEYVSMEPQGSTGIKQTQLRNDFDIDFFIGLDFNKYKSKYNGLSKNKIKQQSKNDFLDLCNKWIIKSLNPIKFKDTELFYAEHPYVRTKYVSGDKEVQIDIVLYFDLDLEYIMENGPITSVDRSPWHGRFIRDNLTTELKDEVRLLKQFFKACHCYGDKSALGRMGFIGYSAELLIYHYKSLKSLFLDFDNLKDKILDYHGRSISQIRKISHMKDDPLIIIDPIDKNRNVASAISLRAYRYCNHVVKNFLKEPKEEFFNILPIKALEIDENHPLKPNTFILELTNSDPDVHYTINRDKLYSFGENIKSKGEKEFSGEKRFERIEFELNFKDSLQEYNLAFYCKQPHLSKTFLRKGPPIKDKRHAMRFKEKNPSFVKKNGFLWIEETREYIDFLEFLQQNVQNRLPINFEIININTASKAIRISAKQAINVLINMVLPFL